MLVLAQDILLLMPVAAHGPDPCSCDRLPRAKHSRGGKRDRPLHHHSLRGRTPLCRALREHRYPVPAARDTHVLCRALGERGYPVLALRGNYVLWRALGDCMHPDPARTVDHAQRNPLGKHLHHPVEARGGDHITHKTRREQKYDVKASKGDCVHPRPPVDLENDPREDHVHHMALGEPHGSHVQARRPQGVDAQSLGPRAVQAWGLGGGSG